MKHALRVVFLGAAAALAAHVGWYRLNGGPQTPQSGDQLAWMKTELRLTDEQYARISSLYHASTPRLQALSDEVIRLREAYAAFESTRIQTDRVDFLAFADFMRHQREVDRDCSAAVHELVDATRGMMNPAQQARYAQVIGPALAAQGLGAD